MVSQTMSDEAAPECKTNGFHATAERLTRGDRVRYEVDNGGEISGTVCKSNRGGIRVLPDGGSRLHVIKLGCKVRSVHPDGGALRTTRKEGTVTSWAETGETAGVEYKDNRGGWTHE